VNKRRLSESLESTLEDPYAIFVFAMNAAQTREKYITRLTIQERCRYLLKLPRKITNGF
jgi:hypothetical protein